MIRGKLKRTASYLLSAALLLSNMGGAAPALADAVVQEATPSGAECQHPNAKSEQIQEWGDVRSVGSNNPILKWCLTNTGVQTDRNGNIVPIKNQSPKQRIDGTAALLDCYVGLYEHYNEYTGAI